MPSGLITQMKFAPYSCSFYSVYICFPHLTGTSIKGFLTTIGVFLFYFCYSLYIGSNTENSCNIRYVNQIKPYLAFFCVYSMMPRFSESQKNIMKSICLVFWFLLLLMGLGKAVEPRILFHLMGHPAYYAGSRCMCFPLLFVLQ